MSESIEISGAPRGRLSTRAIAMPADTNPFGHVFGGWLMSQMDLAGGTHSYRRARGHTPTVAVEGMEFHQPVYVGDEVSCYTEVIRVGRTSISIRVEAWVRRHGGSDALVRVTSAVFTYVAVDDKGKKRPVPPEE
ncbi:putative acyl-CoA thioester hydrolase yciA [Paramagnetospirillum caucaseum]|uniref:Putative acyl-CoA thioester hydrolase yciA n=1 Tax=Paramagnetospirillum caucaseum TaxID=1244869 RepID=M2YAX1_9PROT|nr:acyl-CoA thioesterase [Paramagnetospirillum caucaseum]EME70141.1 putative acyl-CoA thioester hydrolase yciA [Paramagnetospirillum caucaseum]